ncbi:unnamed protein product [Callosobruchus maculatus]|uniref:Uncharacterized protein n=1 Tax=Callosobruchus maculatus TaxID=64391 RepID=A0A653CAF0_CALMS|nr:unnamed protein product [Callosobruchus maculatus]
MFSETKMAKHLLICCLVAFLYFNIFPYTVADAHQAPHGPPKTFREVPVETETKETPVSDKPISSDAQLSMIGGGLG